MLTEEQIKNLQPGDPLIMHGTFEEVSCFGNIVIKHKEQMLSDISTKSRVCVHPSAVSLPSEHGTSVPTPKYDPCRKFKRGDKVRIVEYKGRSFNKYWEKRIGQILTVTSSEDENSAVVVDEQIIDPAYLQLITPVEELEPYSIDPANSNVLFKHGKKFATFEDDDEAQDLCDRLNAEYRKKPRND